MIGAVTTIELPSDPLFKEGKLVYKDLKTSRSATESVVSINIIDHVYGSIDRTINVSSEQDSEVQHKILIQDRILLFCDCDSGTFASYDLASNLNICRLSVKLKKGAFISMLTCSRVEDNVVFYTVIGENRIRAIATQNGVLNSLLDLKISVAGADVSAHRPNMIAHPSRSSLLVLSESGSIQLYDYSAWTKLMKKKFFDTIAESNAEVPGDDGEARSPSSQSLSLIATFDFPEIGQNATCKCTHWAVNNDFSILHVVYNQDIMCTYSLLSLFSAGVSTNPKTRVAPTATYQNKAKPSQVLSAVLSPICDVFFQVLQSGSDKISGMGSRKQSYTIALRSLSDQTLPPLHYEDLMLDAAFPTLHHFFFCPFTNRLVVLTKGADQKSRSADATKVLFVDFSPWWRSKIMSPLVATHVTRKWDGENSLAQSANKDDFQSILAVVPSVEILGKPNHGSVQVTNKVYAFSVSSKPESKSGVFDFDIPAAASDLPLHKIAVDLSADDLLKVTVPSLFVPQGIIAVEPWVKVVVGHVFVASETATCLRRHAAYLVQCSPDIVNNMPNGCWASFRSVAPILWNHEDSKLHVTSTSHSRRGLLAISSDGTSLKYLPFVRNGEIPKSESFNLPSIATGVWSSIDSSSRRVLFCLSNGADENSGVQRLVISDVDQLVFSAASIGLSLLLKEQVVNVDWETGSKVSCLIGVLTSHRVLLLSSDLQILSSCCFSTNSEGSLIEGKSCAQTITSIQFSGSVLMYISCSGAISYLVASYPQLQSDGEEKSITEFYEGLCLDENENHQCETNVFMKVSSKLSANGSAHLLCAFPDRFLLMYKEYSLQSKDTQIRLVTRPVMLGEPTLLGLISQSERNLPDDALVELFRSMAVATRRYFDFGYMRDANKVPPLSHLSNKLIRTLHSFLRRQSSKLLTESVQNAFDDLKILLLDLLLNLDEDTVPQFPRGKWILPSVSLLLASLHQKLSSQSGPKATVLKKGKSGAATSTVPFNVRLCAEFFINHRPDLVEILFEPSAHGGSTLLPPLSAVAKQCAAMSRVMLQEGLFEVARIFADFAGDDFLVFLAMICECSRIENNSYGKSELVWVHEKLVSRKADFRQFKESLVNLDGSSKHAKILDCLEILETFIEQIQQITQKSGDLLSTMKNLDLSISEMFSFSAPLSEDDMQSTQETWTRRYVTVNSMGSCGAQTRRPSLQVLIGGPLDARRAWLEKAHGMIVHKESTSKPIDTIVSSYYLMDSVEDWLCLRSYPDLHSPSELFSKINKQQAVAAKNVVENESRPSTWVDGVGVGKDWEKLVAYWRFSDPIGSKEDQFISTGLPPSRLCLPDISKYGRSTLEVFSNSASDILFETSRSPCDPGDGHDKVKALYDCCVYGDITKELKTVDSGMRVVMGRGGPLDIGMYHKKMRDGVDRNKMTIELWVQFTPKVLESTSNSSLGHCLVNRHIGAPLNSSSASTASDGMPLWSLYVDHAGSVCFSFFSNQVTSGAPESKTLLGRSLTLNTLRTNAGMINVKPSDKNEDGLQVEPSWVHIALVLDDSIASIFVDGNCEVKGSLVPPAMDENSLAISTLYVGLNLVSGWRFTELRVWADARSPNDIAQNKDNYLALAAKRKRLLLNFSKGPKEKEMFLKPNTKPVLEAQPTAITSSLDTILNFVSKVEKSQLPSTGSAANDVSTQGIEKPKVQPIKFDAPSVVGRRLQSKPQVAEVQVDQTQSTVTVNETSNTNKATSDESAQETQESNDAKQPKVSTAAAKRLQAKLQKSATPGPLP